MASSGAGEKKKPGIEWREWSDDIFAQAKKQNRFVLLDLGAVWCHWCHVMEEITYRDPKVIALINSKYIPVRSIRIQDRTCRIATKTILELLGGVRLER